jgi:hypothetical protein
MEVKLTYGAGIVFIPSYDYNGEDQNPPKSRKSHPCERLERHQDELRGKHDTKV